MGFRTGQLLSRLGAIISVYLPLTTHHENALYQTQRRTLRFHSPRPITPEVPPGRGHSPLIAVARRHDAGVRCCGEADRRRNHPGRETAPDVWHLQQSRSAAGTFLSEGERARLRAVAL